MASTMIKRLWNDRRGATAWVVMIAMVPLLGMVSLGTEVGSWHAIRRHAQSAADAAAIAAATELVINDPTKAVPAGQAFANSNGFATGGGCPSTAKTGQNVCITAPSTVAPGATVTAVVTQYQPPLLTQWFVPAGQVKILARAVVKIEQKPAYCALALEELNIGGSSTFAGKCGLMSNGKVDPPPPGQNPFLGGPNNWTVGAADGCTGNANACNLSGKVQSYGYTMPPVPLPPALDHLMNSGVVPPEPTGNFTSCTVKSPPSPSTTWQGSYCVPAGGVTLSPGLYMFRELQVNGPLHGAGVNIIIGSGGVSGSGNMDMTAGTGGGLSDMNGVLIFDLEGNGKSKKQDIEVKYTGQFTANFDGAIFFPYAWLTFRGGSDLTGCMVVVAKILDFSGNSSMDMSGCGDKVPVPQAYVVMLSE